jgi:arsenite-transporting ATPase
MRTFTYLNLYGYLTDAVVVNRVFPDELAEGYFSAWHGAQREQLAMVADGFAPVPVLQAPYFANEVIGMESLEALGEALFAVHDPRAVLHDRLAQELTVDNGRAELRLDLPFADKGDVQLKKIGLELIVRVDGHKRTMLLPPALDDLEPRGAAFDDGALTITFERVAAAAVTDG